jgi:cell division septum initiation protein DivIVA
VEDDQIHGIGQQSQGLHVACEDEINRLKQKVQQLRETRDSLKTLLNEAQKEAQEGHASTREVLRHMMSMHESESQMPVTPRRPLFRTASRSWSWSGVKRENADEAESGGTPTRGPKRVKQKEVVDLTE